MQHNRMDKNKVGMVAFKVLFCFIYFALGRLSKTQLREQGRTLLILPDWKEVIWGC